MPKKKSGEDLFLQKMRSSVERSLDNSIYCRFCGQPIELYNQGQDILTWERKNKCHYHCARKAMHEQQMRRQPPQ